MVGTCCSWKCATYTNLKRFIKHPSRHRVVTESAVREVAINPCSQERNHRSFLTSLKGSNEEFHVDVDFEREIKPYLDGPKLVRRDIRDCHGNLKFRLFSLVKLLFL